MGSNWAYDIGRGLNAYPSSSVSVDKQVCYPVVVGIDFVDVVVVVVALVLQPEWSLLQHKVVDGNSESYSSGYPCSDKKIWHLHPLLSSSVPE